MEVSTSYGTSWADQWDNGPDPVFVEANNSSGGGGVKAKYGKKVGEGLGKTKTAASRGVTKVKEGTSVGVQWIKDKYHKTTLKRWLELYLAYTYIFADVEIYAFLLFVYVLLDLVILIL